MKLLTTSLLAALAFSSPALAVYTQEASTFSAGGGVSTSGGYENIGVIGQPGIVGSSTGGAYSANHGFLAVLGDGFKILYPVIAVTPGTLIFTLAAGSSGNHPFYISNSGGSTLAWSVVKNSSDTIFSFTPTTGSNSGSVTVTANAAGLVAGSYQNTLSISGAGIEQTALIQLDLTVSAAPTLYTLAVTLKLATPGKGGGTVTSTVPDGRLSCQRTRGTLDKTCSADFPAGSSVTLRQSPDSNTTWATWGAPGCGTNQDCQIVLNTPQGTDVTLPYSSMAKINIGTGYESLALAYGGAAATDTIKARAVTFPAGDMLLDSAKAITLLGGLDAYYVPQNGQYSTLSGKLVVKSGKLIVDKLKIR